MGREGVISGYGHKDLGAGIGPGVLLFSDLTSSTPRLRDDLRDDTCDDLYGVFHVIPLEMFYGMLVFLKSYHLLC